MSKFLPRVFRATDGSVAVQVLDRLQEDVYEIAMLGPEVARMDIVRGQLIPGEVFGSWRPVSWHEMTRDPRSVL